MNALKGNSNKQMMQVLPWKSSGKKIEFYERWLKSPAFGAWIVSRDGMVRKMLEESGR